MSAAVIFRMGADSAGLRKDLEAAGQMAKRTAGKMTGAIGAGLKAGLAGLGVGAVMAAGKEIIDFAGNLADASDAMGIAVDSLQELQGAFGQSGAKAEVVNKGLAKLSESLTAAKAGGATGEKLVATFGALGVTWEEINTLAPDEILMRIAASAKDAQNPAERLAAIVDVLGKSGLKMAAGLNSGEEALRELRKGVAKLSAADIKVLDEFGDKWDRLGNSAKVAAAKVALAIPRAFKGQTINHEQWNAEQASAAEVSATGAAAGATAGAAKPKAAIPDSPAEIARKKALSELAAEQAKMAMNNLANETANANKIADHQADIDADERDRKADDQRQFFEDQDAYEREKLQNILDYERRIAKAREDGEKKLADLEAGRQKTKEQNSKATLAELAANARNATGAKARQALRLEERGEKFRKRGDETKAAELQQRADDLKRGIRPLKDSEKGADFQAALDKAKVLQDIRDNIKEVQNAQ